MMGTSPRRTASCLLAALLLLAPLGALLGSAPARADEPPAGDAVAQAKQQFLTAEAYYRKGDYKQAVNHYLKAYEIKPHPSVLYNIAECYEKLSRLGRAAEYYQRYLNEAPDAKDRAKVEAKIADLRNQPSRVSITSNPPGAAVTVDGEPQGQPTPLHVALTPGRHTVEATYRGRRPERREIECSFGRPAFVTFDFGARSGRLLVSTSVEGVEVKLDGEVVGYTPYEGTVAAGSHVVDLTLYGYEPIRRELTIVPGRSHSLTERMRRLGGADDIDVRRGAQTPFGTGRSPYDRPRPPTPPPEPPRPRSRYTAGVFGGGQTLYLPGDTPAMGGILFGIQSGSRAFDLECALLLPTPVVLDFALRWYIGTRTFRPFLRVGMLLSYHKETGDAASSDYVGPSSSYGIGAGAGLALDLGPSFVLFTQVSANVLLNGKTANGDVSYRNWVQVPVMVGVYFKI